MRLSAAMAEDGRLCDASCGGKAANPYCFVRCCRYGTGSSDALAAAIASERDSVQGRGREEAMEDESLSVAIPALDGSMDGCAGLVHAICQCVSCEGDSCPLRADWTDLFNSAGGSAVCRPADAIGLSLARPGEWDCGNTGCHGRGHRLPGWNAEPGT